MQSRRVHTGSPVQFRLGDAICPDFSQIAMQVSPNVTVSGEVVFFSDCGKLRNHFAIVEVEGLDSPLVVPTDRLIQMAPDLAAKLEMHRQKLPEHERGVSDLKFNQEAG